jgi:PAS domain S-box-containing protein
MPLMSWLRQLHPFPPCNHQKNWQKTGSVALVSSFLLMGTAAVISYRGVRAMLLEHLKYDSLQEVHIATNKIDQWLLALTCEVETIASTPTVQSMDWKTVKPYLQQEVKRLSDFPMLALIQADGSYSTTNLDQTVGNLRDRRYFQQAMAGKTFVDDLTISQTTESDQISIAAPVWSTPNPNQQQTRFTIGDRPIGVLVAPVPLSRMNQLVAKLPKTENSFALVIDSQGRVISNSHTRLFHSKQNLITLKDKTLTKVVQSMLDQHRGIEKVTLENKLFYITYAPLEKANWSIALITPAHNVERYLITLDLLTASVAFLLMAAIGLIITVILRQERVKSTLKESEARLRSCFDLPLMGVGMTDSNKKWIEFNDYWCDLLGYSREELMQLNWTEFSHPDDMEADLELYQKAVNDEIDQYSIEKRFICKDGEIVYTNLSLGFVKNAQGSIDYSVVLMHDITKRKKAEKQLKASLHEKDVMLKEIHHRVKNNLQIVTSLLRLQANYIEDKTVLDIFRESQNRIRSMLLIHEKLYRSEDLARTDFAKYIHDLAHDLFHCYGINPSLVSLQIRICNVLLGLDTAIPCGLIVNELVSNAFKYAFPNERKGKIYIRLSVGKQNNFVLRITDDGIGIPPDIDFRNTSSLGLSLVCTLVDQLQGTIDLNRTAGGTDFKITFTDQKQVGNDQPFTVNGNDRQYSPTMKLR